MQEPNISIGIDIGNTKVITCVGKFEDGNIDIIGFGQSRNQGIRKGVIVDLEETVSAITASLQEAERMSGYQIRSAVLGITGPFIESEQSRGIIAISRTDGVISEDDVSRVLDAARAIPSRPNREVLHTIPQNYLIDSTEYTKDPLGMTGIRLEVMSNIITASTSAVKALYRAAEQSGINSVDLVFAPIAAAKLLLSKRQIEIGVMLVDIGASTTSYAIYEESEIVTCGVIPVGSMHITNDIAIGLRTNLELAEEIKIKYGYAVPDKVDEKEIISLSKLDKNEDGEVNIKYVAEIIEARLNEIFLMIKDNMVRENCNEALPAGIVLTGGGALIEGIVEMTKETMRLPAQIGRNAVEISGLIDKLNDPIYSTSIGLMLLGKDNQPSSRNHLNLDVASLNNAVSKVKSLFKHFIP